MFQVKASQVHMLALIWCLEPCQHLLLLHERSGQAPFRSLADLATRPESHCLTMCSSQGVRRNVLMAVLDSQERGRRTMGPRRGPCKKCVMHRGLTPSRHPEAQHDSLTLGLQEKRHSDWGLEGTMHALLRTSSSKAPQI